MEEILFMPLGGGQRVGASCYFLKIGDAIVMAQQKACEVATKMINGELLTNDEEQFLLTKLEK